MKYQLTLTLIAGLTIGLLPIGVISGQVKSLSQSVDESSVVPGNSFVCESGGFHFGSSYYRSFNLDSFGFDDGFSIQSLKLGVEIANEDTTGSGGDIDDGFVPLTINLYWKTPLSSIEHSANGDSNADASVDVLIPGDGSVDLTVVEIPLFVGVMVPPVATDLVVEIFSPGADGPNPNDDLFVIGSNLAGQTAPSFLAAAACNTLVPTDTADIGFPNMHIVLVVDADIGPPCCDCSNPLGDVDQSGQVDQGDLQPFIDLLLSGEYQCEADTHLDFQINLQDVSGFVDILTNGG